MKLKVRARVPGHVSLSSSRDPDPWGWGERNWKLMKSGLHSIAIADRKMASKGLPFEQKTRSHATGHHRTWKAAVFLFIFVFVNVTGGERGMDPFPPTALTAIRKLRKLRTRFGWEKRERCMWQGNRVQFVAPDLLHRAGNIRDGRLAF